MSFIWLMVLMLHSLKWKTELRNFNSQVKSRQTDRETENESGYRSSNPFATPTQLLKAFVCVKQVWRVSSWLGWNECLNLRRLCYWNLVVASGTPDPCDLILWIWTMNWWKNWWEMTRHKAFVGLILPVCLIVFLCFMFIQDNIAERECCGVPCKCIGTRGDRGGIGLPGSKVSKSYVFLS